MRMMVVIVAFLSGLGSALPAAAQQAALQGQQVRAFLASYPEMKQLGDAHRDEMPKDLPTDPTQPFANTLRFMESSSVREQFIAIAQRYGFDSLADWTNVAGRVVRAYVAVTSASELDQMRTEIAQARRDLAIDPNTPAGEKARINQQLDNTEKLLEAYKSSPGDKAAVEPYLQEVARIIPSR